MNRLKVKNPYGKEYYYYRMTDKDLNQIIKTSIALYDFYSKKNKDLYDIIISITDEVLRGCKDETKN